MGIYYDFGFFFSAPVQGRYVPHVILGTILTLADPCRTALGVIIMGAYHLALTPYCHRSENSPQPLRHPSNSCPHNLTEIDIYYIKHLYVL